MPGFHPGRGALAPSLRLQDRLRRTPSRIRRRRRAARRWWSLGLAMTLRHRVVTVADEADVHLAAAALAFASLEGETFERENDAHVAYLFSEVMNRKF